MIGRAQSEVIAMVQATDGTFNAIAQLMFTNSNASERKYCREWLGEVLDHLVQCGQLVETMVAAPDEAEHATVSRWGWPGPAWHRRIDEEAKLRNEILGLKLELKGVRARLLDAQPRPGVDVQS